MMTMTMTSEMPIPDPQKCLEGDSDASPAQDKGTGLNGIPEFETGEEEKEIKFFNDLFRDKILIDKLFGTLVVKKISHYLETQYISRENIRMDFYSITTNENDYFLITDKDLWNIYKGIDEEIKLLEHVT